MKSLIAWFDSRTGIKKILHEALYEPIPGGAKWRYVWGSTLVFAFVVQVITGIVLWMSYSPSRMTAWESVYYIQHEMSGGWFLRGLHHFMAQAMVVLLALHLMQVVICGAYKAPREVNFWLGLVLMLITLGLALTGYLLPWDQKGYWGTVVATNISGSVPVVGPAQQKLAVGGDEYGHHTLTRFFALHAGVLPGMLIGFLALHIAVFRKHGIHVEEPTKGRMGMFWPDQILKDAVACLAVLLAVVFCIFWPAISGQRTLAETGHLGAELNAPTDPSLPYNAARPEWYFLFLFQFLKLFSGDYGQLIGAIIIPGLLMGILALMPILGRWKLGHGFNVCFLLIVLGGAAYLTYAAIHEDTWSAGVDTKQFAEVDKETKRRSYNPEHKLEGQTNAQGELIAGKEFEYQQQKKLFDKYKKSQGYLHDVADAKRESARAIELAGGPDKIPPTGALDLMRNDPGIMGPRLFKKHCASCHDYRDPTGKDKTVVIVSERLQYPVKEGKDVKRDEQGNVLFEPSGAPNLYRFASREWIRGLLDKNKISHAKHEDLLKGDERETNPLEFLRETFEADYFGNTAHASGDMANYVRNDMEFKDVELDQIATALSARAKLEYQKKLDAESEKVIAAGLELYKADRNGYSCASCHEPGNDYSAPVLDAYEKFDGYGSYEWLTEFIANPANTRFYGEGNDRMPAFAANRETDDKNLLTKKELDLLVRWLRGEGQSAAAIH